MFEINWDQLIMDCVCNCIILAVITHSALTTVFHGVTIALGAYRKPVSVTPEACFLETVFVCDLAELFFFIVVGVAWLFWSRWFLHTGVFRQTHSPAESISH